MKQVCLVLMVLHLLLPFWQGGDARAQEKAQDNETVRFTWAFGALKKTGETARLIAIDQDTTLHSGDELKMLLEFEKGCYAYVIYQGPQNEIGLLFPERLEGPAGDHPEARRHTIPPGGGWFQLDEQKGLESFHLIVSSSRLPTLESLIVKYRSAPQEDRKGLAGDVVAEIRRLKREHRSLKAAAERPVQIVGGIRGSEKQGKGRPDIEPLAVEISAEQFYSRTFTIEHR